MSGQANYFRLGLFVLVAIAIFVGTIVVLGGRSLFSKSLMLESYFEEPIDGIAVGSQFKYRGVPLGRVSRISFVSEKYRPTTDAEMLAWGSDILVEIEVDPRTLAPGSMDDHMVRIQDRIDGGLRVRTAQSGITAPPHLSAVYLDSKLYLPIKHSWTPEYTYIPSAPSTMGQILLSVENILRALDQSDVGATLDEIKKLMHDADQAILGLDTKTISDEAVALLTEARDTNRRIKEIVDDPKIDQTINDLSDTMASARNIVVGGEVDLESFVADLPEISARLRSSTERIDELLQDPRLEQMLSGLLDTTENASPALAEMKLFMRRLNTLLATQAQDLESLIINLRTVSEDLGVITEDAKDNPSRLLFGDPPPRLQPGEEP